ncbi:MAG TPA: PQQ-binding-like beta-propeller repeat protein [Gemmataceae bacterium]|nr:PQQ-binding-like beta-propeller repeat protein [Gemmataceae bacterium]
MWRSRDLTCLALVVLSAGLPGAPSARADGARPKLERKFAIGLKEGKHLSFPGWIGFDSAGRYIAVAYDTGDIRPRLTVWDAGTGKVARERELVRVNPRHESDFGLHAAFHPAGSHVLSDEYLAFEGDPLGTATNPLHARTVTRGAEFTFQRMSMFTVGERVIRHATVYPDHTLYIDTLDPDAMRYDPANVRTAKSFTAGKKYVLDGRAALMAMDPGGTRVAWAERAAGGDESDTVRDLDLATGKSRVLRSERPVIEVRCLAFSPDGRALVSGCADGFVRLWAAGDGRERWCVAVHEYTMGSAAFTTDGGLLACGSLKNDDANLLFYEPATGKVVWAGAIEASGVISLAFNRVGDKLAVLAGNGIVYVYDVTDLRKSVRKK